VRARTSCVRTIRILFPLLLLAPLALAGESLNNKKRDAAIAKAIAYLEQNVSRLPDVSGTPRKPFTYSVTGLVYLMSDRTRTGKSRIKPIKEYLVDYVEEVERRLQDPDSIAPRSGNFSSNKLIQYTWPIATTGLFFGELHQRGLYQAEMKQLLPRVIAILDAAQQPNGGWGHHVVQQPRAKREAPPQRPGVMIAMAGGGYPDTLTAACNTTAITLGSLRHIKGIPASRSLAKGIEYYRQAQLPNGSFGYDDSQRSAGRAKTNASRTAGALYAMHCLGMPRDRQFEKSVDYVMNEFDHLPDGHGSSTLNLWQAAMACHALGKREWKLFRESFEPRILANQDEDGHLACICDEKVFGATNDSKDPFGGRAGVRFAKGLRTYTTALHTYILLLDKGKLKLHRPVGRKRTTTATARRGKR